MKKWLYLFVPFLIFWFGGGCATPVTKRVQVNDALVELEAKKQRQIALESRMIDQNRLSIVSYPILAAAVPFCRGKLSPSLGVAVANKYTFSKDFQNAAIELFSLGEDLQIINVVPQSSAGRAGLLPGDRLVSINGTTIPLGNNSNAIFYDLVRKNVELRNKLSIGFWRDGSEKRVDIVPDTLCDYQVLLGDGDEVNAYADGKNVVIEKGMLRFAKNDLEISLVISHELAHNTMKHVNAKMRNFAIGSILDILAGFYGVNTQGMFGKLTGLTYSQAFEAEADYVGLYIMANAGLEIGDAAKFWRRMAAEHPNNIKKSHLSSHPAIPERFVAIEQTIKEIDKKRKLGLPLTPEYKLGEKTEI